ncbi:MAG TPA: ATP-binding cassette domain-containing protein [Planctomycetota bacterium]|nr:ATP-binding cassette domain-containing protein [Planctomycetota bacterium]
MSVEVEGLTHRYGERVALDNVSFSVRSGDIFGVVGPNGGGKSTLFKILSTAIRPSSGRSRVAGLDITDDAVRRKIGVVFQSPSLDQKLTVAENLLHHGHLYGLSGGGLRTRIADELSRFKLSDRSGDRVEQLSGGLQRRVELAKALLHRPEVLLLDEPSTGLDPGARHDLWGALRSLTGVTVLLTTHLLEEAEHCDRLAILHKGKLVALGEPFALRAQIGGDVVTVRTRDAQGLAAAIHGRFGESPEVIPGAVRMARDRGHELVGRLLEAFPERIESVTVAKPSLEDVFLARTREVWS